MKCIYVSAPNTQYLFVPHDMHPSRVYETICYHVICLHETLDVYCNDMYLCFLTKHSIRICPVWFVSRTSSFRHDTVWSNFISRRYAVMSFVCTKHSICILTLCIYVSAPNSWYVLDRMICIPHEFVSTLYCMIKFHLDFDTRRYAIMSFVCTKHWICIVMKCIYVSSPITRFVFVLMICIPHEFVSTRYGMIQWYNGSMLRLMLGLMDALLRFGFSERTTWIWRLGLNSDGSDGEHFFIGCSWWLSRRIVSVECFRLISCNIRTRQPISRFAFWKFRFGAMHFIIFSEALIEDSNGRWDINWIVLSFFGFMVEAVVEVGESSARIWH